MSPVPLEHPGDLLFHGCLAEPLGIIITEYNPDTFMVWSLKADLGLSYLKVMPRVQQFHKAAMLDISIVHKILKKKS